MHQHVLYEGRPEFVFPLLLANGVTGVRDMHIFAPHPLERLAQVRREIAEGKMLGPRIVSGGLIVDGPIASVPDHGFLTVSTTAEARQVVDSERQAGVDFIKVYNRLPRDVYFAIADEAKRQAIPFAGHVPSSVTAAEASDAGQKSIEHLTLVPAACSGEETAPVMSPTDTAAFDRLRDTDLTPDKRLRARWRRLLASTMRDAAKRSSGTSFGTGRGRRPT